MGRRSNWLLGLVGLATALAAFEACVGEEPASVGAVGDDASSPPVMDASPGEDAAPAPSDDAGRQVDADADAGPARFCATQSPPLGIADFFCADFDGADLADGFTTTTLPDGGALVRTTDVYVSEPASFASTGGGTISWTKGGASPFTQVEANLHLNPAPFGAATPDTTGHVRLFRLAGTDGNQIDLRYTKGATVGPSAYEGYYVAIETCTPGCISVQRRLATAPPVNVWTDIRIVWSSTGAFSVSYNGISILNDTAPFGVTSTSISAILGPVPVGAAPQIGRHAFDNLRVSVRR